jgi:flagellar P-ring protein FlgI
MAMFAPECSLAPSPLRGEGWGEGDELAMIVTFTANRCSDFFHAKDSLFRKIVPSPQPSPRRGEGAKAR